MARVAFIGLGRMGQRHAAGRYLDAGFEVTV